MYLSNIGWAWGLRREPLLRDAILLAQKLAKLGFLYDQDKVRISELLAEEKYQWVNK